MTWLAELISNQSESSAYLPRVFTQDPYMLNPNIVGAIFLATPVRKLTFEPLRVQTMDCPGNHVLFPFLVSFALA